MFKFNFSEELSENEDSTRESSQKWIASKQITPELTNINKNIPIKTVSFGQYVVKYISDKDIIHDLKKESVEVNNCLINADSSHSDLVTSVYEGGLKIWECTFDLLNFIENNKIELKNKNVLDLGCGTGLVGISCSLRGSKVIFQDYNDEVIRCATIPNVLLNEISLDTCDFYCGDWNSFADIFPNDNCRKFDFIFTSETIYNVDNYQKLLKVFKLLLKQSGIVYLAAKFHYFGVGGGIAQFEDELRKQNIFNWSTAWKCTSGIKRSVMKITLK